MPLGTKMLKML